MMTHSLAAIESVFLVSVFKPLAILVVVGLWAYVVSWLDKDLKRFYLAREAWNGGQMAAGITGICLMLFVPVFLAGLPLAVLVMGGTIAGYAFYRNQQVPEGDKWEFSLESFTRRSEEKASEQRTMSANVRLVGSDGSALRLPDADDPRAAAHTTFEAIMTFGLPRNMQRLELLAEAQQTAVTVVIDGVKYPQPPLEAKLGVLTLDYLKAAAGLDVADRRRKQTGKFRVETQDFGTHTMVVNTAGSTRGVSLSLDLDPALIAKYTFDNLGLLEAQKQRLQAVLEEPGRIVMVAGPPDHGITTTLYALLARHDPYTLNVLALEDETVYELEGVRHEKIDPGMDAAALNQRLKALLLREANVIMLSRVPDPGTVQTIAKGAEQCRFYFGLRQDDAMTALRAWVKAVGDPRLAADSLAAVVAQRLVRRLCTTCRIKYVPDPDALRKINLPPDKVTQLFKHSGQVMVKDKTQPCPNCLGIGYKGMMAVFEVLALDDEARDLIAAGEFDQLRAHLRRQKNLWLQEAALARAVEGLTSISEITRAMSKEPAKPA